MAEGDEFKDCDINGYSLEELLILSIREDANGDPCLNICGTVSGGGGGGSGITFEVDNVPAINNELQKIGGQAVDTATYAPAYTAGDAAMSKYDKDNGGKLINQADLAENEDEVTAFIRATTSDIGSLDKFRSVTGDSTGVVINAVGTNLYRIGIINKIVNSIIFIKLYDQNTIPDETDIPVLTLSVDNGIGQRYIEDFIIPVRFSSGLSIRVVQGVDDADTTDPSISPIVEIEYK